MADPMVRVDRFEPDGRGTRLWSFEHVDYSVGVGRKARLRDSLTLEPSLELLDSEGVESGCT